MTPQTTDDRLPWLFFVGPDGVVRTSRGCDQATTHAALVRHGLADRLGH
jgi:hypothetical protein